MLRPDKDSSWRVLPEIRAFVVTGRDRPRPTWKNMFCFGWRLRSDFLLAACACLQRMQALCASCCRRTCSIIAMYGFHGFAVKLSLCFYNTRERWFWQDREAEFGEYGLVCSTHRAPTQWLEVSGANKPVILSERGKNCQYVLAAFASLKGYFRPREKMCICPEEVLEGKVTLWTVLPVRKSTLASKRKVFSFCLPVGLL